MKDVQGTTITNRNNMAMHSILQTHQYVGRCIVVVIVIFSGRITAAMEKKNIRINSGNSFVDWPKMRQINEYYNDVSWPRLLRICGSQQTDAVRSKNRKCGGKNNQIRF